MKKTFQEVERFKFIKSEKMKKTFQEVERFKFIKSEKMKKDVSGGRKGSSS
jgi:hypothetical protein